MTAFFSLLKLQLKQQFRPRRGRRFGSAALIVIPLAFIPIFAMFTVFYSAITVVGATLGAPGIGIELAVLIAMLGGVMLGLTYIISSFYYAADLQLLIPLPIRPDAVLYTKFVILLLNEVISMAILYLPAIVGYGLVMHPGVLFWVLAAVSLLLLPVIPLGLAAIAAMAMMALTNGRVNRDALRVVLSLFFIAFWIGFQALNRYWASSNFSGGMSPEGLAAMQRFLQSGGLLDLLGRYFPPSVWVTRGLLGHWPSLLAFVAVTLAVAYILAIVARRLFYRGLIGGEERGRRRRQLTGERLQAQIARSGSPAMAVFRREVREFNRTPAFLMQGLMPVLMLPVYVLMPVMARGGLGALRGLTGQALGAPAVFIAIAATQFLFSATPVASTAFSREGGRFWMSRALPLSARDQVRGKLLHALALDAVYLFVFGAIATAVFRPTLLQVLVFVIADLLGAILSGAIGLRLDLVSPRLDWVEPQQAFKSNYNGIYALLLYVLALLPVGLLTGLMLRFGELAAYLTLLVTLAGAAALVYNEALRFADVRYDRIEL